MKVLCVIILLTAVISGTLTEKPCTPGVRFYEECNVCSCTNTGLKSCTYILCPPGEYDEEGRFLGNNKTKTARSISNLLGEPYTAIMECQSGKVFENSCNTCVCNQEGNSAICTKMNCVINGVEKRSARFTRSLSADINNSFTCVPGESYKQNCNTCICNKSGKSGVCTQVFCGIDDHPNEHEKVKRDLDVKLEIDCEPRSTFKDECNLCHCSESGEYAICTAMACVPGLNFGARFNKGHP